MIHSIESERQAAHWLIDGYRTHAERNRLGQVATPKALAVDIACFVGSLIGACKGKRQGQANLIAILWSGYALDDDSVVVYWFLIKTNNKSLALSLIESRP